jgi:hypothetical protein
MIIVALSGKAKSGKDTVSSFINNDILTLFNKPLYYQKLAFADPIKEICLKMFPKADKKCLYGSSELRSEFIPDALTPDGYPLSYRQSIMDIGEYFKRYNKNIWVNILNERLLKAKADGMNLIIISDARFLNEFEYIKSNKIPLIRVLREDSAKINHISETEQNSVSHDFFDHVIINNSSIADLHDKVYMLSKELIKSVNHSFIDNLK